jgi:CheY-like chemotaxis protein
MIPKKILIIENSAILCQTLSRLFLKQGWATFTAATGADGLIFASLNNPDSIVLDLLLPDMDGFDVCEQLKKNERTQPIPVVLFTGRTRVVDIMRGFDVGTDMFIGKGLGYEKLVSYIKTSFNEGSWNPDDADHQLAMKACRELLDSLYAAFESVLRPRLEIALGVRTTADVFEKAAEKLQPGWKIQTLRERMNRSPAVRDAIVEFNTFVSELFGILDEMGHRIEVNRLRNTFEQQLALFD